MFTQFENLWQIFNTVLYFFVKKRIIYRNAVHTSGAGENDAAVGRGYFETKKCETSGSKSSRG